MMKWSLACVVVALLLQISWPTQAQTSDGTPSPLFCTVPPRGEDFVTDPASQCSSDKDLSDADIQEEVAREFAPVLYFHPAEEYFLGDPETYISNTSVYKQVSDESPGRFVDNSTSSTLWKYSRDPDYILSAHKYFVEPNGTDYRYGSSFDESGLSSAPVYFNVFEHANNTWVINYWFFYPYNGCSNQWMITLNETSKQFIPYVLCNAGVHQGDWEHVSVMICPRTSTVLAVSYGQHEWNEIRDCRKGMCIFDDENSKHPLGISALNSHATYPEEAANVVYVPVLFPIIANIQGVYLVDRTITLKDKYWKVKEDGSNLIRLPDPAEPTADSDTTWPIFEGYWGNASNIPLEAEEPRCISYTNWTYTSCEHWEGNIFWRTLLTLFGLEGGDEDSFLFGIGAPTSPLGKGLFSAHGPQGPLAKPYYREWEAYHPSPILELIQNDTNIEAICPSSLSGLGEDAVTLNPAKDLMFYLLTVIVITFVVAVVIGAFLCSSVCESPERTPWGKQLTRARTGQQVSARLRLMGRAPLWSISGFVFVIIGLVCVALGMNRMVILFQEYFSGQVWIILRIGIDAFAALTVCLNTLVFASELYVHRTVYLSLTQKKPSRTVRIAHKWGHKLFGTLVALLIVALMLTVAIFTLATVMGILNYLFAEVCAYTTDALGGVCIDLSLFSRDDIECGDELRVFCNLWTESGIYMFLSGAFFLLLGCILSLLATATMYWHLRYSIEKVLSDKTDPARYDSMYEDIALGIKPSS